MNYIKKKSTFSNTVSRVFYYFDYLLYFKKDINLIKFLLYHVKNEFLLIRVNEVCVLKSMDKVLYKAFKNPVSPF